MDALFYMATHYTYHTNLSFAFRIFLKYRQLCRIVRMRNRKHKTLSAQKEKYVQEEIVLSSTDSISMLMIIIADEDRIPVYTTHIMPQPQLDHKIDISTFRHGLYQIIIMQNNQMIYTSLFLAGFSCYYIVKIRQEEERCYQTNILSESFQYHKGD